MSPPYPRVAGRVGELVSLNMSFYRNGSLESPFAIRQVDIYRDSPRPGNLVASIPFPDPTDTGYPFPAIETSPGQFQLLFDAPDNLVPCDIYFDQWSFLGKDPGSVGLNDESRWITQSGMFWLYDDAWIIDDDLFTKRLGFEPLDKKLRRGEIRTIEVAIYPLPMYEYNFNQLAPIIPQLRPTIDIKTARDELIVQDVPCYIGTRQGSHRNSPFVVKCPIDTRTFLRGMYRYTIKVNISGQTIISQPFSFIVQ